MSGLKEVEEITQEVKVTKRVFRRGAATGRLADGEVARLSSDQRIYVGSLCGQRARSVIQLLSRVAARINRKSRSVQRSWKQ